MKNKTLKGQIAIEYLLILTVCALVAFGGFKLFFEEGGEVRGPMTSYFTKVQREIVGDEVIRLPDPPKAPPLVCRALPTEDGGGTPIYHECYAGIGGAYEVLKWCEGNCSSQGGAVTLCCNKMFDAGVITLDVVWGGFPPLPSLDPCPAGTRELVSWCAGNCSGDDESTRICIDDNDLVGVICGAIAAEDSEEFPLCPNSEYGATAQWCSGNCDYDDAKVTICCVPPGESLGFVPETLP